MKVVINNCYGGFGLSDKACKRLVELGFSLGGANSDADICRLQSDIGSFHKYYVKDEDDPMFRSDPRLIKVIEELRSEANGSYAKLEVVEIPDGVDFVIEEYDGNEWIAEKHRVWRLDLD